MSWICNNQLGRRNLTTENKRYLIGKRYDAEKILRHINKEFRGNQHTKVVTDQNDQLPTSEKKSSTVTRDRIARETGTSSGYVQRADEFAKGVDAAEEAVPGIKKEGFVSKIICIAL